MKYYVYLTVDNQFVVLLKSYVDENDPDVLARNKHWIEALWSVDSEDPISVYTVLESAARRRIEPRFVKIMTEQIGVNLADYQNGKWRDLIRKAEEQNVAENLDKTKKE